VVAALSYRTRAGAALLCGAALLGTAWWLSPPAAPPLYDGLVLGDDPYRYLSPPPDYRSTPPPTSARLVLRVRHGRAPAFTLSTTETPPQAQLTGTAGALGAPSGATSVVATLVPVKPPAPAPHGQRLDGNVYRFRALAAGVPVGLAPGATVIIALRGTGTSGQPTLVLYDGHAWSRRPTVQTGTPDDYAAIIGATGDIALVLPLGGPTSSGPAGASALVSVEVVALFAGLLAALLLLVRITRRPSAP